MTTDDPNIVILVYRMGNQIIKEKDHYEVLEKKIKELEKQGIEGALFATSQEHLINAMLARAGARRQFMN